MRNVCQRPAADKKHTFKDKDFSDVRGDTLLKDLIRVDAQIYRT